MLVKRGFLSAFRNLISGTGIKGVTTLVWVSGTGTSVDAT